MCKLQMSFEAGADLPRPSESYDSALRLLVSIVHCPSKYSLTQMARTVYDSD
jgi:hypothetical protein